MSYQIFRENAPAMDPRASLIKEKVAEYLQKRSKIRWLDKPADELSKGRPIEKILR